MESKDILGTWQLKCFEIKGIKTPVCDWRTFLFRKKGTYEESYYSNQQLIKAQIAKVWKEEPDGINLYCNDKPAWQVKTLTLTHMLLYNIHDNMLYYLEKD